MAGSESKSELEAVLSTVRERVDPSSEERERLRAAVETLTTRAQDALAECPVDGEVLHLGSTARDTWLSGDRDIDIFVRFPPSLPREELERYGLEVGHAVLKNGYEEYAEHPYVKGTVDGFDIDIVPCYAVESAREIESAVDRTPFHAEYLDERLTKDVTGDIRLTKQFLTAIDAYGSDLRTEGFSGYLVELLVLEYGGFRELIEAAADWHPPVTFDPEAHGARSFDDPLVVIDPTDPERNVAAVLSAAHLARFEHYARELLATPRVELFVSETPEPFTREDVREEIGRRGTTPVAIVFDAPDIVDDQLYPQLRRSLTGAGDELDRRGFDVLRRTAFADDRAVLFLELAVAERPNVERHEGPPVHARRHAERFYETYDDTDAYGPFIDGDRYVVERDREFTTATAFLESDALFDVSLGADIEAALREEYDVVTGEALATLADEFGTELADYFSPTP